MSDGALTNPSIDRAEHVDENVSAKRVFPYTWDGSNLVREGRRFVNEPYDYVSGSPDMVTPTTLTFKSGGSGGTTVATLTFTYSGSNVASITKS